MAETSPIVGIDLGGTNMQIGVVNGDHKVIGRAKRKSKPEEGRDRVIQRIVDGVREACEDAKIDIKDVAAIGIGAPGAIDPETGTVLEAVNLRWDNVPLADLLSKQTGCRVVVDNDVNAAVYGENRLGAGENARDLLGVWIGTGIGGGLILNGALYYGSLYTAGEIGHTILFPNNPPGARSLEQVCSRTSIVERLTKLIRANEKSIIPSLVDGDLSQIKSKVVAKAYESGDPLTVEVVDDAARLVGISIAGVVTLLSLGRVVLGGGLTEALGKPFVQRVEQSAREHAFPAACRKVEVVESALADAAGVFGAAMIAQERLRKK